MVIKQLKLPPNFLKIAIPLFLLVLVVIIGVFLLRNRKVTQIEKESVLQYTIQRGDKKIDIYKNGFAQFSFGKNSFSQSWDKEKIDTLYKYIKTKGNKNIIFLTKGDYIIVILYEQGSKIILYLPADDPEMQKVFETFTETGGGGGGGSGGGGNGGGGNGGGSGGEGDIFNFNSPPPSPTASPTGGENGGGSGIPQKPDDCPLWLLSWCVYPHGFPSPSPAVSTPVASVVPDCSYWLRDVTDKAIISNTFCIQPSSTP